MWRSQYRNFGTHETLVGNLVTDVDGADRGGIRWYELRRTGGGAWALHQEGTYSPDTTHRWMGSIAMDGSGNIALGYSASSSSVFPSIRYTGRLAGDALGTMPQVETTIVAGAGSQTDHTRWGDYSSMNVDPADDCTFWYTNEYTPASGLWNTQVASFRFAGCGSPLPSLSINDVQVTEGNTGTTNAVFTVTRSPSAASTSTVNWATVDGTAVTSTVAVNSSNPASIRVASTVDGPWDLYPSPVAVASSPGPITKVTVTLHGFGHTYPGDVDALLSGPGGETVILMSDVGENGNDAVDVTYTFDDDGGTFPGTPASGTYAPTDVSGPGGPDAFPAPAPSGPYGSSLSVFNGISPVGTWNLYLVDDSILDAGAVTGGWTLTLSTPTGDYTAASGTLLFVGGDTSETLSVSVRSDTTIEPDEAFFVDLSSAAGATIADAQGTGTILNDDAPPSADLSITKSDDVDPIAAGNTLTYTLTVNNAGPDPAAAVVVTDTLPAGVTFAASSGCTQDPNGVPTCALGDLAAGASAQYTIQVTVDAGTTGILTNQASVSSATADPNPGNNTASETTSTRGFTDDPLVPGETSVKAVHFTEPRARIDALLPTAFPWTELIAGTTEITWLHLLELRTALDQAYAYNRAAHPPYTPADVGTLISAIHIMELRQYIIDLEGM